MKKFIIIIILACLQTFIGHHFDLHSGLPHMQYEHWGWYAGEIAFYSIGWALIFNVLEEN